MRINSLSVLVQHPASLIQGRTPVVWRPKLHLSICLLLFTVLGKSPQAASKENKDGVRRQLASLQKETGITLAGFPSNYFLHIAFKDRSVSIERTSLPGSRTAEGALSPDGSEVAFRWSTSSLPQPENEFLRLFAVTVLVCASTLRSRYLQLLAGRRIKAGSPCSQWLANKANHTARAFFYWT